MAEQEPVLSVRDLSFSYDPGVLDNIFTNISFDLHPGEIFTILGPNGVGKSTLFNCINRDLDPQWGTITLAGKDVHDYSPLEIATKLGYVQQSSSAAFEYTVRDFLVMGRNPYIGPFAMPGDEDFQIVEDVLAEFHLEHLGDKSIKRISGGERQQVQIARALVQQTDVIMLDEPTNHLDFGNQLKVLSIVAHMARDKNIAILMTTHTPDHAIMLKGKTGMLGITEGMTIGPTEEIVTEEMLRKIYRTDLLLVDIPQVGRKACVAGQLEWE